MSANGQLTASELSPISGGQLANPAAASWNAMNAHSPMDMRPTGPNSSYRSLAVQWYFWRIYQNGGNLAAYPGTSNHGWGLAVDMPWAVRHEVDRIGHTYGWAKEWSDAPSEWWHVKYRAGVWNGSNPGTKKPKDPYPTLKKGRKGNAVRRVQKHLRRWNIGITQPNVDGVFGERTAAAVRQFQAAHRMRTDGVVGNKTWHVLRRTDPLARDEREHVNKIRVFRHQGRIKRRQEIRRQRNWLKNRVRNMREHKSSGDWWDKHKRRQRYKIMYTAIRR